MIWLKIQPQADSGFDFWIFRAAKNIWNSEDAVIFHGPAKKNCVCLHINKKSVFWERGGVGDFTHIFSNSHLNYKYQGGCWEDVKKWHPWGKTATCRVSLKAASLKAIYGYTDSQKSESENRGNACEVTSGWSGASSRFASQSCEAKKAVSLRVPNQMTQLSRPGIFKEVQEGCNGRCEARWRNESENCWKLKTAHSCDRSLRSTLFPNSRRRTSSMSESSGLHVHTGWEGIWKKNKLSF